MNIDRNLLYGLCQIVLVFVTSVSSFGQRSGGHRSQFSGQRTGGQFSLFPRLRGSFSLPPVRRTGGRYSLSRTVGRRFSPLLISRGADTISRESVPVNVGSFKSQPELGIIDTKTARRRFLPPTNVKVIFQRTPSHQNLERVRHEPELGVTNAQGNSGQYSQRSSENQITYGTKSPQQDLKIISQEPKLEIVDTQRTGGHFSPKQQSSTSGVNYETVSSPQNVDTISEQPEFGISDAQRTGGRFSPQTYANEITYELTTHTLLPTSVTEPVTNYLHEQSPTLQEQPPQFTIQTVVSPNEIITREPPAYQFAEGGRHTVKPYAFPLSETKNRRYNSAYLQSKFSARLPTPNNQFTMKEKLVLFLELLLSDTREINRKVSPQVLGKTLKHAVAIVKSQPEKQEIRSHLLKSIKSRTQQKSSRSEVPSNTKPVQIKAFAGKVHLYSLMPDVLCQFCKKYGWTACLRKLQCAL